jgi:hypothetical protein
MGKTVENWDDAVADVYSYLKERERTYDVNKMLRVLDLLALHLQASQDMLLETNRTPDFIATTLSLVTMAVHGKGAVPPFPEGWYRREGKPPLYTANPLFAAAWSAKRKLS